MLKHLNALAFGLEQADSFRADGSGFASNDLLLRDGCRSPSLACPHAEKVELLLGGEAATLQ